MTVLFTLLALFLGLFVGFYIGWVSIAIRHSGDFKKGAALMKWHRESLSRQTKVLKEWAKCYAKANPTGKYLKQREARLFAACKDMSLVTSQEKKEE